MPLSKRPPLHRELREDREQDRGRLNVLFPEPHHQHREPRATKVHGIDISARAARVPHHSHADGTLSAFELRVVSHYAGLELPTQFPQSFHVGRLDASYWFSRCEPKLSFHLVHREEPPETRRKAYAERERRVSYEGD
jgi:hypothetical protein